MTREQQARTRADARNAQRALLQRQLHDLRSRAEELRRRGVVVPVHVGAKIRRCMFQIDRLVPDEKPGAVGKSRYHTYGHIGASKLHWGDPLREVHVSTNIANPAVPRMFGAGDSEGVAFNRNTGGNVNIATDWSDDGDRGPRVVKLSYRETVQKMELRRSNVTK